MPSRRLERVNDLVLREVAAILQREVKDPRIGLVTLTGVEVSPDLKIARVFYSIFGDEDARQKSQEGLERASGYIRREVAHRLRLKFTPELRFVFDPSLARGMEMEALIESTHRHEPPQILGEDEDDGE